MTRRDVGIALIVATVAALVFVAGMGLVVSRNLDSAGRVRVDTSSYATVAGGPVTQVPVLCYHYLRDKSGPLRLLRVFGYVVLSLPLLNDSELWTTSVTEFARHMEFLRTHGYQAITLRELHEWQLGQRELPAKPVVVTFDDGDESVYNLAFPILERLDFRATLFVITSRVGTEWNGVHCMDWDTLRRLEASGVFQIESHTHDMHYKVDVEGTARPVFVAASEYGFPMEGDKQWEARVRSDLIHSRQAIERSIGRAPAFLAWPYGAASSQLDRIALEAGFLRTCTLRAQPATRSSFASTSEHVQVEIPRYTVTARTSLRDLRTMLGITRTGT
jgi:peptidoglycan/xylan/chitin deacetylase (PgdA/CDA1 family)